MGSEVSKLVTGLGVVFTVLGAGVGLLGVPAAYALTKSQAERRQAAVDLQGRPAAA
ncbi:MAG: hypothetical protein FJ029_15000 [Actinobacteria bacterium]|nr:hypothetical protein [Actinomycetota bacterium]